ncbi:DUF4177 domain-containing protein [Streptomyces sp. NPDC005728]|uniref:DUF4177 domain-containing protein n=1 Tax=Streptomyces sp. NPDC005728 TaxID=3157054 RepID=UPI0033CC3617
MIFSPPREPEITKMLEEHGRQGWQLVSHAIHGADNSGYVHSLSFAFKRPK